MQSHRHSLSALTQELHRPSRMTSHYQGIPPLAWRHCGLQGPQIFQEYAQAVNAHICPPVPLGPTLHSLKGNSPGAELP